MRVNIDEIKEAGLRRRWDVGREQVDEMVGGDQAGYRAREAAHFAATLDKVERRVLVDVRGKVGLTAPCGRCLQPVGLDAPVEFELTLVPSEEYVDEPRGEDTGKVVGSFEPQQAEEEVYSGKVIELDPILREQIVLALPRYPVCKDDCKGLCPVCGANLNDRECGCDRHVPDPRWAALKNVKL